MQELNLCGSFHFLLVWKENTKNIYFQLLIFCIKISSIKWIAFLKFIPKISLQCLFSLFLSLLRHSQFTSNQISNQTNLYFIHKLLFYVLSCIYATCVLSFLIHLLPSHLIPAHLIVFLISANYLF